MDIYKATSYVDNPLDAANQAMIYSMMIGDEELATMNRIKRIDYKDSVFAWRIPLPIFGKPGFVDKAIELCDRESMRAQFESFLKFSINLYFFKFVWLTFYGVATEKYMNKLTRRLKEIAKGEFNGYW